MPFNGLNAPLVTKRLLIRRMEASDAPELEAALSDPAVMARIEPPFSSDQTAAFIEAEGLCQPPRVYAVAERDSGRVIGHAVFHPFDATAFELGWILRRDRWGRGYAAEITDALVAHARRTGIPALVIEFVPDHRASRRVAEKCGFEPAGEADSLTLYRLEL